MLEACPGAYIQIGNVSMRGKGVKAAVGAAGKMRHERTFAATEVVRPGKLSATFQSSTSSLCRFKIEVAKPSVNQPWTGAGRSRAAAQRPWFSPESGEARGRAQFPQLGFLLLATLRLCDAAAPRRLGLPCRCSSWPLCRSSSAANSAPRLLDGLDA